MTNEEPDTKSKGGTVVFLDMTNTAQAFYLTETGWQKVRLPENEAAAALYHSAATHRDEANWIARIFQHRGKFSSEIHPKATFAQVANAVMEHGAYPCFQCDAAYQAGINTVLAVSLQSCECGVRERGIRISRGETNV